MGPEPIPVLRSTLSDSRAISRWNSAAVYELRTSITVSMASYARVVTESIRDQQVSHNSEEDASAGSKVTRGSEACTSCWCWPRLKCSRRYGYFRCWSPRTMACTGETTRLYRLIDIKDRRSREVDMIVSATTDQEAGREVLSETPDPADRQRALVYLALGVAEGSLRRLKPWSGPSASRLVARRPPIRPRCGGGRGPNALVGSARRLPSPAGRRRQSRSRWCR